MIKKLQRKFVLIAMGSLLLVTVVLLGTINIVNYQRLNGKSAELLQIISENDGRFPVMTPEKPEGELMPPPDGGGPGSKMTAETPFETRYFTARIDAGGEVTTVDTSHIAAISTEEAKAFAESAIASKKDEGYEGSYRFLVAEKSYGSIVVFVDCHRELETARSFLLVSVAVALICLLIVLVLVTILSKRAVRPVMESMEKQKRFITDAGHEIKTPLAVISANADVLELSTGQSEWLDSIRSQTSRLDRLARDLLMLAKMEEEVPIHFESVDLSTLVSEIVSDFAALGERDGKHFTLNIAPDLSVRGNEYALGELVSVLMDNAVKYASDGGEVAVSLHGDHKNMQLQICNQCDVPLAVDPDKLFDRFYRDDASRSRETGGYGLGLAIAKAIAEAHGAKIAASVRDHQVCFTVVFPR